MERRALDLGEHVVAICTTVGDKLVEFNGSGFFVSNEGHVATCKHVLPHPELGTPAVWLIGGHSFHRCDEGIVATDDNLDLAFLATGLRRSRILPWTAEEMKIGNDVAALGLSGDINDRGQVVITPRFLKGHVTRVGGFEKLPSGKDFLELSFAAPGGCSGTPLIWQGHIAGMIFGNLESSTTVFTHSEVEQDGNVFKERISRIVEFGVAHSNKTIQDLMG